MEIIDKVGCKKGIIDLLIKNDEAMYKLIVVAILFQSICDTAQINSSNSLGNGKTILLDYYFNNEYKKDSTGKSLKYHYTWEDTDQSGYSLFGSIFKKYGAKIRHLSTAPSFSNLKKASVYIIVDPDTKDETDIPNFISEKDANVIYNWVKAGGVLLLLLNDSAHADFEHTNILAKRFGMRFIQNSLNQVYGSNYETGALTVSKKDSIFKTAKKIYIKELASLSLTKPAKAHYENSNGDIIMAISKIGKGTVFAVGDPWFYNEYIDNKILPAQFENTKAANDLVKWLLQQAMPK